MTEDDLFDQPLQKENTSTDKLNTKDNQQLCTKQIESTNVESMSTESDDEDMELVEEQAAVNCRQELTGDLYLVFYNLKTWKTKYINVHLGKITFPNICY